MVNGVAMKVDLSFNGLLFNRGGCEQIEIDGAPMPQIQSDGRATDQIIVGRKFPDQGQEINLFCR
jgi:hypothetical protein